MARPVDKTRRAVPPAEWRCAVYVEPAVKTRAPCFPIGSLTNTSTGLVIPKYCGKWACPRCGPGKVKSWCLRIKETSWNWFLTLTLDGDGGGTRENFKRLALGWAAVRQFMKRQYNLEHYTWVRERGNRHTRRIHMHVIFNSDKVNARELHKLIVNNGNLGRWKKLQRVRHQGHARRYVAKYLTKEIGCFEWPKYTRRVQTTVKKNWKPSDIWVFDKKCRRPKRRYDKCPADPLALYLTENEKLSSGVWIWGMSGYGWNDKNGSYELLGPGFIGAVRFEGS